MTCIVGLAHEGVLYMGADSVAVSGWDVTTQRQPKIFRTGDFLIGVSGYPRLRQILQYRFTPPVHTPDRDDLHYMSVDFVDAMREASKDAGYARKDSEQERVDSFTLVGYRERFYVVEMNYQVVDFASPYAVIGSGESYALGALYATQNAGFDPLERVRLALRAAEEYSATVRGPFMYLTSHAPVVSLTSLASVAHRER